MNRNRLAAGVMAVTIATGNIAMAAAPVSAATVNNQNGKEEVVYIITDSEGKVDNVNVVNIFGKGSVTDYGNYSQVKMLNTTDKINQQSDKITFSTDKDKAYYQGTLENAQIPWNITFEYILDGRKISADELAGKSGALQINIKISQNENCTTDFYDNYALQAAVTMDTDKCKNINADGATMANVGADKQISYTVLPGKGLDAVITADVTDFEMDAAAINGVKMNLNIDIDDGELMDKVSELMDASRQLNDGATAVYSGTGELLEAQGVLADGASTLNGGIKSLDEGVNSLDNGIGLIQTALDTLNSKSSSLTDGSAEIYNALKLIQKELSGVQVSTDQLKQLTDSSAAIKQGINDLYASVNMFSENVTYEAYKQALKGNGLDLDELSTANNKAIASLGAQINDLKQAQETLKSIPGYETNEAYVQQIAQLQAQIESLSDIVKLLTGSNANIAGSEQYFAALSAGASQLVSGTAQLKDNYDKFDTAIVTLTNNLGSLLVNVNSLKEAINQLTDSYSAYNSGVNEYTQGVASIAAGYSQIVDGMKNLAGGSRELVAGSDTLKDGTISLYDGTKNLNDGAGELNAGTEEFYTKTQGMDTQIEDTIDELLNSLTGDSDKTESFVSDKNTNVESVQFVIKTSAIKKQTEDVQVTESEATLSFWQKLINLFKKK